MAGGSQAAARQATDFVASSGGAGAPSAAQAAHEEPNVERRQQLESHSEARQPVSAAAATTTTTATATNNQSKTNQQQEPRQQQQMGTIDKEAANCSPTSTSLPRPAGRSASGSTKAMGKFKEKRPGPLNLTPSLNHNNSHHHQDTPLDLSVKSAGNLPSGAGNIFNLQISANQTATTTTSTTTTNTSATSATTTTTATTTLETPRIAWHENEAQLLKQQHPLPLYSSTSANASQIARLSLAGDSPPITPSTPFVCDPIMSPIVRSVGLYDTTVGSFRDSTSSLQSLVSAQQFHYSKAQQQQQKLNDNLLSAILIPSSKSISHLSTGSNTRTSPFHHQELKLNTFNKDNNNGVAVGATRAPRRSCSTDNLSLLCAGGGGGGSILVKSPHKHHHHRFNSNKNVSPQPDRNDGVKRTPISPLVLNNLSSTNRFSYSSQSISSNIGQCNGSGGQDDKMNPAARIAAAAATSTSALTTTTLATTTSTSASNFGAGASGVDEAALLVGPDGFNSSVANATRNLLNIHLNSPNTTTTTSGPLKSGGSSSSSQIFEGFSTPMTPFSDLLAASQQKSPLVWSRIIQGSDQNLDPLMSAVYCQQNQLIKSPLAASVSSSTSIINHHLTGDQSKNSSSTSSSSSNQLHNFLHYQSQSLVGGAGSGSLLTNAIHSLGSTGTLNTPTIISPNQLKTYYLPSPNLSPMSSSVFELPSPLVVFPRTPSSYITAPSSATTAATTTTTTTSTSSGEPKSKLDSPSKVTSSSQFSFTFNKQMIEQKVLSSTMPTNTSTAESSSINGAAEQTRITTTMERPATNSPKENERSSDSNLSQLVTSAKDKVGPELLVDEELDVEVRMEVESQDCESMPDEESHVRKPTKTTKREQERPGQSSQDKSPNQSIPKILVSDCQLQQQAEQQQQQNLFSNSCDDINCRENQKPQSISRTFAAPTAADTEAMQQQQQQQQHRVHRDVVRKRALSPQSFKTRIDRYYDERHESCSAPPGSYEARARTKMRSVANSFATIDQPSSTTLDIARSCGSIQTQSHSLGPIHHQHYHKALANAPYPAEVSMSSLRVGNGSNASGHHHHLSRSYTATPGVACTVTVRSSSADLPHQQPEQHQQNHQHHHYGSSQHLAQNQFFEPSQGTTVPVASHHQFNYSFSQSAQHLHQGSAASSQSLIGNSNAIKGDHNQSVSADELNSGCLLPFDGTSFARVTNTNQQQMSQPLATFNDNLPQHHHQHHHHHHQHHHQHQQHQHQQPAIQATFLSGTTADVLGQFQNNSPSSSQLEEQINQLAAKPSSTFAALNQTQSQGLQMVRFQADDDRLHRQQQQQPHHQQQLQFQQQLLSQPRALSADLRALSRSESSCSSADFCFRSSSSASGTPAKKYHCDQCSKAFTRSDMLTRHRRLHSGDRPFQCNECKQEFSRSDHLSTHMRTHTGEKPYKCKLCSYSACRKDMITRHMKVHNRSSPLPPALSTMDVEGAVEQQ